MKGSDAHSTNNRMELTAALEALRSRRDGEKVELHTDSEYLRKGITQWISAWRRNGWARKTGQPVLNKDLWIALYAENKRVHVEWRWVKAHAGHVYNEMVDQAARDAAIDASNSKVEVVGHHAASDSVTTSHATPLEGGYYVAAANLGERRSAWAFVHGTDHNNIRTGVEDGATLNRAIIVGAVELIRSLPANTPASVTTDSEYLYKGATQWLDGWRRRDWRKADMKPIANKELWIEMSELLEHVDVNWQLQKHDRSSDSLVQIAARVARETLESTS